MRGRGEEEVTVHFCQDATGDPLSLALRNRWERKDPSKGFYISYKTTQKATEKHHVLPTFHSSLGSMTALIMILLP